MLSLKLVPTLATTTALLLGAVGVAVAGGHPRAGSRASAHHNNADRHPQVAHDCRVSIDATPRPLTADDPVVIFGQITCAGGTSAAGQTVVLLQHDSSGRSYTQAESATTEGDGSYEFAPIDGVNTESAWYVRAGGARSPAVQVPVAAAVTLSGPAAGSQLLTGSANMFTGTVSPADAGYAVMLERQDSAVGNRWDPLGQAGSVNAEGGFTIASTFLHPGAATLRAVVVNRVHTNPHNSPSASNVLDYEVSQPQATGLTIQASPDPIEAGQSVTIGGVGPANRRVTLKAGPTHATIATTTTDTAGKYAFAPQSPTAGTTYRVRVGNLGSAKLYVGVQDVLAAKVSQTVVGAGQPLTFSGTVTPEHAGATIYLERQNASGVGFHVVELAAVGAGSAYSIVHTVYDAGKSVFRVTIPGGPQNEGATSAPFTIEVTLAPASALMPEALGNSSQPFG
jgi:hypothetical protein